jgi:hypothetical protein
MASKRGDLEKALKQNIELRRKLAAEVTSESEPKRETGWGVIWWIALVLIPVVILCGLGFAFRFFG